MRTWKKVGIGVLAMLVIVQFIQPHRNLNSDTMTEDIKNIYDVPLEVQAILTRSCYDCHSNNTNYPWYSRIQPFAWILQKHINEGKSNLNFNEFGNYSQRRRKSKLKAIASSIEKGTMPIRSYTIMHAKAKLSGSEKEQILTWIDKLEKSSIEE